MQLVGPAVIDGRNCWVVTVKSRNKEDVVPDRWYVDPARDSAVVRVQSFFDFRTANEERTAQQLFLQTVTARQMDISYEQRDSLWVPTAWKTSYYSLDYDTSGQPRPILASVTDLKVTEFAMNGGLSGDLFRQPRQPGQLVHDERDGELYKVAEDGAALTKTSSRQLEHAVPAADRTWVWGMLGGAILVMVGLLTARYGLRR